MVNESAAPMNGGEVLSKETTFNKPIVLSLKRKKKRKRQYSRGLEEAQRIERHLTRSAHRMTRAIDRGVASYYKRSEKSSVNKKDGVIRDFIPNTAVAMSKMMKEAILIPIDIADAFNTRNFRKRMKRQIRLTNRSLKAWRL